MDTLLAICDYERKYVYKLAQYLSGKKHFPFKVMAFDNLEKLAAFSKEHPIELLLIGEDMEEKETAGLAAGRILYLCQENKENENSRPYIYKYQSGTAIMKKIIEYYAEGEGQQAVPAAGGRKRKMELIGVYSPIGRCLQTSFSLILGQILAKKKRCLYLNFEAYSGFSMLLEKEFHHDFMDLMYFLKEGNGKFVYKLAGMVDSIGSLDFIPPTASFPDILEMEGEQWQLLLDELERNTDYEAVILDLSDHVRGLFEILERCSRIYTITKQDGMALAKIDQYEKLLAYMKKEELLKKTITCSIPVFKQVPYKMIYLSHSQLADYVKNLLKEQGA